MKWLFLEPKYGDIIRIHIGPIYHYGIFVSQEEIIQFGLPPLDIRNRKSEDIKVISTPLDVFCVDSFLEVAQLDKHEQKLAQKPDEIVKIARSRIGEGGYHILHNNCEHFVNEVVFNKHSCLQEEKIRKLFKNKPIVNVYFAKIPDEEDYKPLYPKERNQEIINSTHPRVKKEKYYVWKLLEYALLKTFYTKIKDLNIKKLDNGKWVCDNFFFSLSHSEGIICVAVSKRPIGVDVEIRNRDIIDCSRLILDDNELLDFKKIPIEEKNDFLIKLWTKKEALFKMSDDNYFDIKKYHECNKVITYEVGKGDKYFLSVASDDVFVAELFDIDSSLFL